MFRKAQALKASTSINLVHKSLSEDCLLIVAMRSGVIL